MLLLTDDTYLVEGISFFFFCSISEEDCRKNIKNIIRKSYKNSFIDFVFVGKD